MKTYNLIVVTSLVITCIVGCKESPTGPDSSIPKPPLPRFVDYPAWHPDGEWIAVEHGDSVDTDDDGKLDFGFSGIWLVHAETGEKQPLVSGFQLPAWSPDGKKLAMVRNAQIFTIDVISLKPAQVDTNSLLQVTTEGRNFFPAWSPNGEWIVYDRTISYPESSDVAGIWIMKFDGVGKSKIAEGRFPDWSPNTAHILFVGLHREIYRKYLIDNSNAIRLTSLNQEDIYATDNRNPKYAPDGYYIAFQSKPSRGPSTIWLMTSDGSNLHKVSPDYAWRFDWSPDGKKTVFLYWNGLEDMPGNGELWLINADGTGLKQLTHFRQ